MDAAVSIARADAELGDTVVHDNPMDCVSRCVNAEEGVGEIKAALPLFGVNAAAWDDAVSFRLMPLEY